MARGRRRGGVGPVLCGVVHSPMKEMFFADKSGAIFADFFTGETWGGGEVVGR